MESTRDLVGMETIEGYEDKMKKTYEVTATGTFKITIDDELLPDDEWRSVFYNIRTMEQVAEHFIWNVGIQRWNILNVEGFGGVPLAAEIVILRPDEWEFLLRR